MIPDDDLRAYAAAVGLALLIGLVCFVLVALVVRQRTSREYDAVKLDIQCISWRRNGWGPLAQKIEACQVVTQERVVEVEA